MTPVISWAAVEQVFHQQVQAAGIVGSSVLLVRDGSVAATATDGYQELATKRPIDQDTIFHWASITKTFTGIAIMQLRDRGRLTLDDPIVTYVPEFRRVHNPFGDGSQVTIRHMHGAIVFRTESLAQVYPTLTLRIRPGHGRDHDRHDDGCNDDQCLRVHDCLPA